MMFTGDVTINAERKVTRRRFVKTAIAATAGLALDPPIPAASEEAFSFVLFVPLNIDGQSLPSDWYLRAADGAGKMLRAETPLQLQLPISP